jgi:hypothetical protein
MIRAQTSRDDRAYCKGTKQARKLGISLAKFVRRTVREVFPKRGQGPWMRYAGLVETGNARSSQSIDEIVYGQKTE